MRSASSMRSSQSLPSPRCSPVTPALVASVTWSAPSERCQASHVSTVPTQRSRARSGSASSSRWATLVADALGATPRPSAWSTRQVPIVRRSCQPSAGPTGSPVARSHTIVEARWLAMPTASTGPALGQHGAGDVERDLGHAGRVELDQAGRRRVRQQLPVLARRRWWRRAARPRPAARSSRRR